MKLNRISETEMTSFPNRLLEFLLEDNQILIDLSKLARATVID